MKNFTNEDISRLQDNLSLIRKAGGWTAEEFGDYIGVTKQTISNLENKKTPMSKTQYIAIRAVLEYELEQRKQDKVFVSTVNLVLYSDDLDETDMLKVQAFVEGATKTGLDSAALITGLVALVGAATVQTLFETPAALGIAGKWLSKILAKRS